MFTNALIGIDELDGGRDAVALAHMLCGPGSRLTLGRIHGAYPTVSHRATNSLQTAELKTAEVALRRASQRTGVRSLVAYGASSAGSGLDLLALELRSDLLVTGSSLGVGNGEVSVGSAVAEAISRSECPIAVAPRGYILAPRAIRRIGVAYEVSAEGQQALTMARYLSARHDAEVVVLEHFLDGADRSRGVAADASRQLQRFSDTVDLVVLGARGAGPLRRFTHPAAPLSLAAGAHAPLMLVSAQTRMPSVGLAPTQERWTTKSATALGRPL